MAAQSISPSDAEAHIAKIRHDKGLSENNPPGHNVADLENALTTLSEQLYQSSTHFLLELIQNADDNSYDSKVLPSVQFTYENGGLRVDCNEVGFSPRNVEALCRVGQSTKKGGDNATRYVGEKGIGFKSVFKAADIVWISSGHYSFKFDKSKPLGMIAPIWCDFPAPIKPGWTSLYLQLSKSYNRRGLLDELRSLDSRLLIFLRRIRSITISISESLRLPWKSSFFRAEIGKDLIRLTENNRTCDYIIRRHQAPTRFFTAYDKEISFKSLRQIAKDESTTESTARRWLKQRENMGILAYRHTRGRSGKLGKPSKVTKAMCKKLVDPARNPVRNQPYEAQIAYHKIPCKKRHLQHKLKEYTNGGQFYKCAFVKKEISARNKDERVAYAHKHKDKTMEDFWSYIFFTDEAHIDPSAQ
ncbi:uncharacterized protein LY89DRAFT_744561 [Mollisia scopiformis]|uniref:Uncharacterized protein n=1 Tax=Mollisia scopiformis TaxID=149040 RepID=A0A194XV09_MOLSC|nr:uncharacterized protein LY89DRAFT_744561 [Mollisia scopiformis]KUJ23971.1 hypothetical protein LY89DRAFT_744561 [Mollisia scopiformis]